MGRDRPPASPISVGNQQEAEIAGTLWVGQLAYAKKNHLSTDNPPEVANTNTWRSWRICGSIDAFCQYEHILTGYLFICICIYVRPYANKHPNSKRHMRQITIVTYPVQLLAPSASQESQSQEGMNNDEDLQQNYQLFGPSQNTLSRLAINLHQSLIMISCFCYNLGTPKQSLNHL